MKEKDEVFKETFTKPSDFEFSGKVAKVFDDMVNRSVPFYEEIQRMIGDLAATHYQKHSIIYDLGCSTGTTLLQIHQAISDNVKMIGIDDSLDMLDKCKIKLKDAGITNTIDLQVEDLNNGIDIADASVVVLCLTLQFVRPINREKIIKKIFTGLKKNGVLIIVEKILAEDSSFNRDFIEYYYEMKRRHHYSEMEISQKREALENVLIPYKLSENITLLRDAGFSHVEVFFKWYNFAGFIAKK